MKPEPLYYLGLGGMQDYQNAAAWWKKAAVQGDAEAQFMTGSPYAEGKGISQNYHTARKWWEKAAAPDDTGLFNLGLLYDRSDGVPGDDARTAAGWKKVIAREMPRSCSIRASLVERGQGVPESAASAGSC